MSNEINLARQDTVNDILSSMGVDVNDVTLHSKVDALRSLITTQSQNEYISTYYIVSYYRQEAGQTTAAYTLNRTFINLYNGKINVLILPIYGYHSYTSRSFNIDTNITIDGVIYNKTDNFGDMENTEYFLMYYINQSGVLDSAYMPVSDALDFLNTLNCKTIEFRNISLKVNTCNLCSSDPVAYGKRYESYTDTKFIYTKKA